MTSGWFITGTDTGVGKTRVACALLEALTDAGYPSVGMKPVASGASLTPAGWRNTDAEALRAASGVDCDYADVNPYCFEPAIAPHLAAEAAGQEIELDQILGSFARLKQCARFVVVEGAGGWRVPLGMSLTTSGLARALELPVVLVVGMRLGCLNHALLSVEAIRRDGVPLAGWIANGVDAEMSAVGRNLVTLEKNIGLAPLAVFPYSPPGHRFRWPKPFALDELTRFTAT